MKKTMNIMLRVAALAIAVVMLAVSVSATGRTYNYKDVNNKHWAYDAIQYVYNEGLMQGNGNAHFNPDGEVNAAEIYATLYRLAGEPRPYSKYDNIASAQFHYTKSYREWAKAPVEWAIESGIAECSFWLWLEVPGNYVYTTNIGFRFYRECDDALISSLMKKVHASTASEDDVFRSATRTDIVLALYYYVSTYLYGTVDASADLSGYSDFAAYTKAAETVNEGEYYESEINSGIYIPTQDEFESAWRWAVTAGIIEGYPDGTLGVSNAEMYTIKQHSELPRVISTEAKYVTRAEYAQMLERFVKYLRDGKVFERTYLVVTDEVAEVTNAEGEILICNNGEFSGTMQVFTKQEIINGGFPAYRKAWLVTVNKSESFSYKYKES